MYNTHCGHADRHRFDKATSHVDVDDGDGDFVVHMRLSLWTMVHDQL